MLNSHELALFARFTANATTAPAYRINAAGLIVDIGWEAGSSDVDGDLDLSVLHEFSALEQLCLRWKGGGRFNFDIESVRLPPKLTHLVVEGAKSGKAGTTTVIDTAAWPRSLKHIALRDHAFLGSVTADLSQLPSGLLFLSFPSLNRRVFVSDPLLLPLGLLNDAPLLRDIALGPSADAPRMVAADFCQRCMQLRGITVPANCKQAFSVLFSSFQPDIDKDDVRRILRVFEAQHFSPVAAVQCARVLVGGIPSRDSRTTAIRDPEQFALLLGAVATMGPSAARPFWSAVRTAWRYHEDPYA
jgi:hypothetical protein